MDIYQTGIRPLLFSGLRADPEWLHQQTIGVLSWLSQNRDESPSRWLYQQLQNAYCFDHPCLKQTLWGLEVRNPVGLAAGFDKDGLAAGIWSSFGFGFAELGTVTLHPQPGNPRPRLFRLPLDRAALNRMGFNNQGAAAMAVRLEAMGLKQAIAAKGKERGNEDYATLPIADRPIPLGINLGKSKVTPLESAAADYLGSFRLLKDWGDYFVINVSSPNTPGLRSLQATEQLEPILQVLQQENDQRKPILIKIAPDLEWQAIANILDLAQLHQLAGIIATNTTIRRNGLKTQIIRKTGKSVTEEAGGISGIPLNQRSTEVVRFVYRQTQGKLPIIGVGGIFTAEDAWEKITAGASLVQVYTGWIYEGPAMVRRTLEGLVQKLEEQGLTHVSQAIGMKANAP
ncbi:MAG: quinone-dependent dihydroorotate dehydrogenase [Leptolyngbyaceae cyanobacterium SL_5_9]|nr:quinone-dependent dihydroorotate dehydrogenase [Leptolyngbyaceae cyanobacterium SM1_4_3]NJN60013.1 quinone-dependent dihydroorotate dehydrogenase [Leptolyngbyaceae cyanobacterium SL_5_9]